MSYCRWSSDNGKCDLYCYESDEGYMTHVASYKQRSWYNVFLWMTDKRAKFGKVTIRLSRHKLTNFIPRWMRYKKIGLPYDGERFCDKTIESFYVTVKCLKRAGYTVPDYVCESIEGEMLQ